LALVVWKFPSGQTVARSRLVAAEARCVKAVLARTAPVPAMNSRRVNMLVPFLLEVSLARFFSYSAALTGV
jgi:hypothetical protein